MASPTPSIESLPRASSIGSFGDQADYLSLSPLADSPLSVVSGSSPPVSDSVDRDCSDPTELNCQQCRDIIPEPKLLACFHTYCSTCLEKNKFICPRCDTESIEVILNSLLFSTTELSSGTQQSLSLTSAVAALADTSSAFRSIVRCTGCKTKQLDAVARCVDCANYLCENCVMAHQFMHCFEGHRVVNLDRIDSCFVVCTFGFRIVREDHTPNKFIPF